MLNPEHRDLVGKCSCPYREPGEHNMAAGAVKQFEAGTLALNGWHGYGPLGCPWATSEILLDIGGWHGLAANGMVLDVNEVALWHLPLATTGCMHSSEPWAAKLSAKKANNTQHNIPCSALRGPSHVPFTATEYRHVAAVDNIPIIVCWHSRGMVMSEAESFAGYDHMSSSNPNPNPNPKQKSTTQQTPESHDHFLSSNTV